MSKPTRLPTSPRPVAESARYPHDGILLFFGEDRKASLRGRLPVLILVQSPPVCPTPGNLTSTNWGGPADEPPRPFAGPRPATESARFPL